jgi:broad specificity phosphatase PhoE
MNGNKFKILIGIGITCIASAISSQITSAQAQSTANTLNPSLPAIVAQKNDENPSKPAFQNKLDGSGLVNALQGGGYVIYIRHGQTEKAADDKVTAKIGDCSTQRILSEQGWQQAKEIGKAFQDLKIPVDRVYSSDYCRAWQTADLAFDRYEKNSNLNFLPVEKYNDQQKRQIRERVMPLLSAAPSKGSNTVIVGHGDVFKAAMGVDLTQGAAYILKPNATGSVEIVANLRAEDWSKLSNR